ncbi:pseudouridine synthase [Candidatus Margulisiibacteriota bacterium]
MKKKKAKRYIVFNKPYGVLSQFTDKEGRPTLKDYIKIPDVYAAGRLDMDSEGLLFLTDDGPMNHALSDPNMKQPKTYLAQVEGIPNKRMIKELEEGVLLGRYKTLPAKVATLEKDPEIWKRPKPIRFRKTVPTSWMLVTIIEGKNRQVKKMTAKVGLPCLRLIRTSIGLIDLEDLLPGQYREIERPDIKEFKKHA